MSERVTITQPIIGIVHSQACAEKDVPREEVVQAANKLNRSGTTNGWHIAEVPDNPIVCADDPNRLHWLLVC